jgi:hypothetical protein
LQLRRNTLIFFLDAVCYEYLRQGYMPFISNLGRIGNSYRLRSIFAFEGIAATLYTGVYPSIHSIWTQFVLDDQGQFRWIKPYMPVTLGLDKIFSISRLSKKAFRHVLLMLSKINGRLSGYPSIGEIPLNLLTEFGVVAQEDFLTTKQINSYPTFLSILRAKGVTIQIINHPLLGTDKDVVEAALDIRYPQDVTFLRLWDLDSVTHQNGVGSMASRRVIQENDENVRRVVEHFQKILRGSVDVFVFADHGMINIQHDVDPVKRLEDAGIRLGTDYLAFLDSTIARFWGSDDVVHRIAATLQDLGRGKILNKQDFKRLHIPKTDRYGKLLFLADPGVLIRPNFFQGDGTMAAMHGYDPSTPDMDTVFVTNLGQAYRSKKTAEMVDIAPTVLDSFGLERPNSMVGQSLFA